MKARRNFVVEFKSNRRQKKEAAASIWGDIDLKALARAVADDLPRRLNVADAPPVVAAPAVDIILPDIGPFEKADKPVDQPPMTAPPETMTCGLVTKQNDTPQPLARSSEATEVPVPVDIPEMTSHAPVRRAPSTGSAVAARETPARIGTRPPARLIGFDDLDALEAENQRLKALWRAQLQRENAELRAMLSRLVSVQSR